MTATLPRVELDVSRLMELAPFAVIVDSSGEVRWASPSIMSRLPDCCGRPLGELFVEIDGKPCQLDGLRTSEQGMLQIQLIAESRAISLVGIFLENPDQGGALLARPKLKSGDSTEGLYIDDFPDEDATVALLAMYDEHDAFLVETLALVRQVETEHDRALQSEQQLREQQAFISTIFQAAPIGIMVVDPATHRIVMINEMMSAMFGAPQEEIQGRECFDFVCPANRGCCPVTDQGQTVDQDERIMYSADGREIPVLKTIIEVQLNGKPHLLETFIDLTERKEMEAQAVHSKKLEAIGQLAAGIAHEINTPTQYVGDNTRFMKESFEELGGLIDAYAELKNAATDGTISPKLLKKIEEIESEADAEFILEEMPEAISQSLEGIERIAEIVAAMKEFSHPGAENKSLADINRAIETTATVSRSEWKYVAELELALDKTLPQIPCFLGDFNQAVLNIIVNGAHAIAEKNQETERRQGKIRISSTRENGHAVIAIEDDGPGIPKEVIDRVFDPFFTTKVVGKGTGQGLAIARAVIVEKHGGALDVASEVGQGTKFTIRLPLDAD